MAQWVKDLVLLLQWLGLLLWHRFDPWPMKFHMPWMQTKKKEKKKKEKILSFQLTYFSLFCYFLWYFWATSLSSSYLKLHQLQYKLSWEIFIKHNIVTKGSFIIWYNSSEKKIWGGEWYLFLFYTTRHIKDKMDWGLGLLQSSTKVTGTM